MLSGLGGVVEGGPETKNIHCCPDPRDNRRQLEFLVGERDTNFHTVC